MKFSEAWLREWVNPQISSKELQAQLTMAGLEVDGVVAVAGEFEGVVVGKVVSVRPHPDATQLKVCEVDDGTQISTVVCGASNVVEGLVTAYARPGAILAGGQAIASANLRGVDSVGMLCSGDELGISDDRDGIAELDSDTNLGLDLRELLALDDLSIDVDLTPNRGDCLSLHGIAREVAVLNELSISEPSIKAIPPTIDDTFPIEIKKGCGCSRYLGRIVRGVDIKASAPQWLVERLRRSGLRSIDPIVDITNYVMLELGQPMHAFDLNRLKKRIIVRSAKGSETLTLLNGQDCSLEKNNLVISDASGAVALAGVMGGESTCVQSDTVDIFLESAFFSPDIIAGTARHFGLHTDASHRFERGVDYNLQSKSMERATGLLLEIVGGSAGPVVETVLENELPRQSVVRVNETYLNKLIGVEIDPQQTSAVLERLGFEVSNLEYSQNGISWDVTSPSFRFDVSCEADVTEEVCRIYGYNRVPTRLPRGALVLSPVPLGIAKPDVLKSRIASLGYREVITYSFVDPDLQAALDHDQVPMVLANPMSSEQSVMRTNLFPGLINVMRFNLARQRENIRIFELGACFLPGDSQFERQMLGGLITGGPFPENWNNVSRELDFYDLKGDLERLLEWNGKEVKYEKTHFPILHPGQAAKVILGGEELGYFGRLHPNIEKSLDLTQTAFIFQFSADQLMDIEGRTHKGISRYPSIRRDLAIVVKKDVLLGEIKDLLYKTLGEVLVDFRVFDSYEGKGIDSNEKSLGVGLTFQDPSATLTDDEVNRHMTKVVSVLADKLGGQLR